MADLYQSFFNKNIVSSEPVRHGQTLTTSHIKLPAVQRTLNHVPAQNTFRQWRALVRTEVLGGIEFATHVVNS